MGSTSHMGLGSPLPACLVQEHMATLCPQSPFPCLSYVLCPTATPTVLTSFGDDDIPTKSRITSNLYLIEVLPALPVASSPLPPPTSALSLYCPNNPQSREQISKPV